MFRDAQGPVVIITGGVVYTWESDNDLDHVGNWYSPEGVQIDHPSYSRAAYMDYMHLGSSS